MKVYEIAWWKILPTTLINRNRLEGASEIDPSWGWRLHCFYVSALPSAIKWDDICIINLDHINLESPRKFSCTSWLTSNEKITDPFPAAVWATSSPILPLILPSNMDGNTLTVSTILPKGREAREPSRFGNWIPSKTTLWILNIS